MLRILICFMIFLGCGYIGISISNRFKRRVSQLEDMQKILKRLEFSISFSNIPLAEAMEKASGTRNNVIERFIYYISDELKNEIYKPPDEIWIEAFEKYKDLLFLNSDDKDIILNLAKNIGKGDVKTERDNIDTVYSSLQLKREEALNKANENEKIYRSVGFAVGAFIAIILF